MKDLFENEKKDLRIVRVSEHDAKTCSDDFRSLREKILSSENMYPDIKSWVDKKVISGLKTKERVGYIGYLGDEVVASAIVKRGADAKFCHLKLNENIQHSGLGDLFFTLMAMEVRNEAKRVHFTLPESLWESKKKFFQAFSFNEVSKCHDQYRLFDEELRSETNYEHLYGSILNRIQQFSGIASIGGFSTDNKLIMSISPEYVEKIMLGEKTVEIRRKFSKSWEGARFNIYASAPIKALMGEARISRVIEIDPGRAWEHFSTQIGASKEQYDQYVLDAGQIYVLILDEIKPYTNPVYIQQLDQLLGAELQVPQSYALTGNNQIWARAISLAAILQSHRSNKKISISSGQDRNIFVS